MNINLWRSGLRAWLSTKVLVDTWDLRNPIVYATTNGFIPPLQSISFANDQVGEATAIQDFYLTSRYSAETKYNDLPIGQLEQTYITITRRLSLEYLSIAGLTQLDMITVADAIQVIEYGDGHADWLVTLVFSCRIGWVVVPTALPGDIVLPGGIIPPPTPIDRIVTGLFTEKLRSTDHRDPATRDKFGTLVIHTNP
jgi:hypothetical protein